MTPDDALLRSDTDALPRSDTDALLRSDTEALLRSDTDALPRSDTDALYQDLILERSRAPRHGALLECFDAEAHGDNPMCGDRVHLRLRRDAAGRITDAGFAARGCAISVASADLMAEGVIGLDAPAARRLSARFAAMVRTGEAPDDPAFTALRALAGVHQYRSRLRCATLPWSALETAIGGEESEA